jgi:GNAT superfamily N-acetyltransferase
MNASKPRKLKMDIRLITEGDLTEVTSIMRRNWDEVISRHHSPSIVEMFRSQVSEESLKEQMYWKRIYVAELDGEVIATAALADFGSPENPKPSISNIFVRPDFHGQGIGRGLIEFLCDIAAREGVTSIHVPSSKNAFGFYQKVGFTKDAVQPSEAEEITWMTRVLG